jgi:hypothetical protein
MAAILTVKKGRDYWTITGIRKSMDVDVLYEKLLEITSWPGCPAYIKINNITYTAGEVMNSATLVDITENAPR